MLETITSVTFEETDFEATHSVTNPKNPTMGIEAGHQLFGTVRYVSGKWYFRPIEDEIFKNSDDNVYDSKVLMGIAMLLKKLNADPEKFKKMTEVHGISSYA